MREKEVQWLKAFLFHFSLFFIVETVDKTLALFSKRKKNVKMNGGLTFFNVNLILADVATHYSLETEDLAPSREQVDFN